MQDIREPVDHTKLIVSVGFMCTGHQPAKRAAGANIRAEWNMFCSKFAIIESVRKGSVGYECG